jgi:hypothetical protein
MKPALLLLVGLVAGAAAGGFGGWRYGNAMVLNQCLIGDAKSVQTSTAALKLLRTEALEAGMDDTLIPFDPAEPYAGVVEPTIAEMNKAIAEVKAYRAANPRKSSRTHVDGMVANLLARGHYPHTK